MKTVLVTVAPPTPNGDLHLGHLSGPYVASDVLTRALRARGEKVHFVTGSDDNQSYVPMKGKKLSLPPETVAFRYRESIERTFAKARIVPDYFLRPLKTPEYVAFVQRFFRKLVYSGKVRLDESDALHCTSCRKYLFEAHVHGACPHCATPTNGNGCEKCGHYNDCIDLEFPRCNHCNTPAVRKPTPRFRISLSDYRDELERFYAGVTMSARMKQLTTTMLRGGLPDVTVSHEADWGIPVGLPGAEKQVIYEWLEMAAGYLFMATEQAGSWESLWKSQSAEVVQCFGFDNGFFYTTLIPALLLAFDSGIRLPTGFVTNEFYKLDGLKFSTSRNHAIWGDEMLDIVPADVLRFHLALTRPETEETNFTMADFGKTTREVLAGEWESWLDSIDRRRDREKTLRPAPPPDAIVALERAALAAYSVDHFSMTTAARKLIELVRAAKEVGSIPEELGAAKCLASAAAPLMPDFAARLRSAVDGGTLLNDQSFSKAAAVLDAR